MKKAFIILSAAVLALTATSCEDWLDMPSYTSIDTETAFKDESSAEIYIRGCYRGLIHQEMYYQLGMGDTAMHSSEDGTTNNSKYNVCNYFYDTQSPYTVTTIFKEQYRIIEATNIAIDKIGKMGGSAKCKALLAEAYAIRAFCYLNLIRIYGDVPAVWQPLESMDPNDENTFYPRRSSRDAIYDRIISDMQNSVDDLPTKAENPYGTLERLTRDAGYALLARIALYAGGYSLRWDLETLDPATMKMARRSDDARVRELYQIASNACQKVMTELSGNSLLQAQNGMSGFQFLWYNFGQRNFSATMPEMLWELTNYGATTNSQFGGFAHTGTRGGLYGSLKAMQFMLPTYYLSFDKKDTRRDVTCAPYSIYFLNKGAADDTWVDVGTTYSCIMHGKFRHNWRVQLNATRKYNLNIPVLRYSDVLLMYAEAQNFLNGGPTQGAKDALTEVRTRAGVADLSIPTSQDAFEEAVLQERKWEFAGEFMLRTDIIRMNRLAKEVAKTRQAMQDLADRAGDYTDVATYRLYKYQLDDQEWGGKTSKIDYIDLTDQSEIDVAAAVPTSSSEYAAYQTALAAIVRAHGMTWKDGDKWYPVNMFEAYTSTFNGNARKAVGFTGGFNQLQIGNIIYTKPTGSAENGGTYPDWIKAADGSDGLYYGFKENCVELLPFAAQQAGHPIIDNPNLTQHPGYK